MKLTKTNIDRLEAPAKGQAFYRDDQLKGFALRVTAGGTKTFVVEKRVHGRNRRIKLGVYGELTVEQARREAQKKLGQIACGIDPVAQDKAAVARSVTLREVFEDYLTARKKLSAVTVHDYERLIREAFSDWQTRSMATISKDNVVQRHIRLGQRSHARANNAMRLLRALFNFARGQYEDDEGRTLFPENPVNRLNHARAWYPEKRRRTVIKRTQLPDWFEAVMALKKDPEDTDANKVADYLLLLVFTGLRRMEGMTLKWEHVDLRERTLTLPQTKNGEPLTLPLSDFLTELLSQRREKVKSSEYVFPGDGEYGHMIEPRKQMRKVTQRSGVKFCPHDLRRTFITVAESLDIPVYAIKHLVNHKMNNDVTAGYVIIDTERLRAPMQKITDFLLSAAQSSNVIPLRRHGR